MTDLEQAVALLDKLELPYINEDISNCSQGNESDLRKLSIFAYGSTNVREWFFYERIGGKSGDKGKSPGDYYSDDERTLKEPYWGDD